MNSLIAKARFKLLFLSIFIIGFAYITTELLNHNLLFQISLFTIFVIYYTITNREQLRTLLNFTKFLMIVIVILHTLFFTYKTITMGLEFAKGFYKETGLSILIRVFIIPNIFAFVNILISKVSFVDLLIISKNSLKGKIIYILMISGIEVMERLRVYYEYHPSNMESRAKEKIIHYLAIPLTLFFGIERGFEKKYNTLIERDKIFKENR